MLEQVRQDKILFTLAELKALYMSKGDVFSEFFPVRVPSFDCALPHDWLTAFDQFCSVHYSTVTWGLILSTTVWVYDDEHKWSGPVTCCEEVNTALQAFDLLA